MRIIVLLLFMSINLMMAQEDDIIYNDVVYYEDIRSVKLHVSGLPVSMPLIALNSSASLTLTFDDLAADTKNYSYEIFHCTPDWKRTDLESYEYLNGFDNEDIRDFEFSINTYVNYTRYYLTFPNQNTQLKLSGNYILNVYDEDNDHDLTLSRRFMVYDPLFSVEPRLVPTSDGQKHFTHHEFQFDVLYGDNNVSRPLDEISTSILQNNQWSNAKTNIKPRRLKIGADGIGVTYDFRDSIVFPGLKEYRNFDMRTLRTTRSNIQEISELPTSGYSVLLYTDQQLMWKPYVYFIDLNGNSLLEQNDITPTIRTSQSELEYIEGDSLTSAQKTSNSIFNLQNIGSVKSDDDYNLYSDYAKVIFSFKSEKMEDKDLYIFGALSDWKIDESFKMTFDEVSGVYANESLLKQGYYNYQYVLKDKETGELDYSSLDGLSYDSENDYLFLVYYKPFGDRYAQLVSILNFNSLRWRNAR